MYRSYINSENIIEGRTRSSNIFMLSEIYVSMDVTTPEHFNNAWFHNDMDERQKLRDSILDCFSMMIKSYGL